MAVEDTIPGHTQPAGFFEELERRTSALSPAVNTGLKRDRWLLLAIGLGMVCMLLPWERLIGASLAGWVKLAAIAVEAVCLALVFYRQIRDSVPDFIDMKRKFAIDMDEHFVDRNEILDWIRTLTPGERAARLAYVEVRHEVLASRYALLFGAVDRLGVLPVLVGVAIQFQALKTFSYPFLVLGVWIVALYCMALLLSRYRLLLENFRRLLRSAQDMPTFEDPA